MTVERISQIGETERARRSREVNFARGNVRHEGGVLTEEIEQLNARYIAGEIGRASCRERVSDTV